MLPERWIDYSGLDLVAISLADFERIPADARDAMVDWVKTGGNLILYDVGSLPSQSGKLAELTGLNRLAAVGENPWKDASAGSFTRVHRFETDSYSEATPVTSQNDSEVGRNAVRPLSGL